MSPEGQSGLPRERPPWALEPLTTLEPRNTSHALIVEPHPAVRTVLEYLLGREGYAVEAFATEESFITVAGPALLLVAAGDGIYVFLSEDVSETFGASVPGTSGSTASFSGATGIRAFLPKPFGVEDVLRVVRMVGSFEGRRRAFADGMMDTTGEN